MVSMGRKPSDQFINQTATVGILPVVDQGQHFMDGFHDRRMFINVAIPGRELCFHHELVFQVEMGLGMFCKKSQQVLIVRQVRQF